MDINKARGLLMLRPLLPQNLDMAMVMDMAMAMNTNMAIVDMVTRDTMIWSPWIWQEV